MELIVSLARKYRSALHTGKMAQTSRQKRGKSSVFRQFQIQCSCYVNLVNTIKVTLWRVRTLIRNGTIKKSSLPLKNCATKINGSLNCLVGTQHARIIQKQTNAEKHLAPL